jgi:acyl-CoA hydrolase
MSCPHTGKEQKPKGWRMTALVEYLCSMSMDAYTMVRPEHLNHHGYLFGGQLLKWVDEYAWLAAARENPGCKLVTRAMNSIEFVRSAPVGAILRFHVALEERGRTSISYRTEVWCDPASGKHDEYLIFSTAVTFVNVDGDGNKIPLCAASCPDDK